MNFVQNAISLFEKEMNAGGRDYVPPATCLPAACVSAYAAARVAGTGRARTNDLKGGRSMRPVVEKSPILRLEPAA
jgi:hypothetical protein